MKHGLVKAPMLWPWTTFHRYVKLGWYEKDWGESMDMKFAPDLVFGE
ncbi:hypothetical protein JXA02_04850 [candidate division KSB1 bacterium]|nr:hypothetical protein [candidate division KSB1 bacterium]